MASRVWVVAAFVTAGSLGQFGETEVDNLTAPVQPTMDVRA